MSNSIFEFHDGDKRRREDGYKLSLLMMSRLNLEFADCLAAMDWKPLLATDGETEEEAKLRNEDDLKRLRLAGLSTLQIIEIAREVFNIPEYSFDGESDHGLTGDGVLKIYNDFMVFNDVLKKNIDQMQSSQASTEPASSNPTTTPNTDYI